MEDIIMKFENDICESISKNLSEKVEIDLIRKSDARFKNALECCKKGSIIYFLYDCNDRIIYIGESGKSLKHRLFTDGNGSHFKKNWFYKVKYARYYKRNMDDDTRKLIERALIAKLKSKYCLYNKG
ncbi:hypothetical protein KYB31_05545 [Clostridium felsineum]|uniref:hypothetical protein n=1 Tax=Clostridium felsineum TaxID=36839 RepID=UPI00214D2DB7|nr:hypothetical protein [Clostridium felsineum]MCR3758459.1 hypothetical protein [Clostridium felsineum]